VRRGWYLGDEQFRQELLDQAQKKVTPSHCGRERQEAAEVKAKRILEEELRLLGWSEGELRQRRKGDGQKIRIARRIRKETTMSLRWIAASLAMGTWKPDENSGRRKPKVSWGRFVRCLNVIKWKGCDVAQTVRMLA